MIIQSARLPMAHSVGHANALTADAMLQQDPDAGKAVRLSRLCGRFAVRSGRTVMIDRYHDAPLKVSKTFYREETKDLLVYIMDASPGMLDGDRYDIEMNLKKGSRVFLTNQSFTKVHPTPLGEAVLQQTFRLEKGAVLAYFPEPLIPYAGSRFLSRTAFHLEAGAALLFADITAPGRTHSGEMFNYASLSAQMSIYREDRLLAWDHFCLEPSLSGQRYNPRGICSFGDFTHMASMWVFADNADGPLLERLREAIAVAGGPDLLAGASLAEADQGIAIRMLGSNAWSLQRLIRRLREICELHIS